MKHTVLAGSMLLLLTACSAAYEVGESLNRATTNISSDPARYLWSRDPDANTNTLPASAPQAVSAPAATQ